MKKNLMRITIAAAVMMAASLALTGCKKEEAAKEQPVETTEAAAEENAEKELEIADNRQDVMEYLNGVYVFNYDPLFFEGFDSEDNEGVTISFIKEDVQTAGSNVVTFTDLKDTDVETALKQFGVDPAEASESAFGQDGIEAYSYCTGLLKSPDSENTICETFIAVPHDNDVIMIDVFRHVGPDEGVEMMIDDQIASVLESFRWFEN